MTAGFNGGNEDQVLTLEDYTLFSTDARSEAAGELATSAVYFIGASTVNAESGRLLHPRQDYRLLVLDERVADEEVWVREGGTDSIYPFVVPRRLARDGIIRYMESTYLETDDPTAINQLRPYLSGPITEDSI